MFSNKTRNRLCKNAVPRLFPSIEESPNQHSNVDQDDENSFDPVNEEDEEQRQELATVLLGGEDDSEVVLQKNQQTQTLESVSTYSPRKNKLRKTIKELQNKNFRLKKKLQKLQGSGKPDYLKNITL
ncbi:uncharacterized protein LOC126883999 [Diabrotica virgifera virgifera]|uniref:Uncharacterized protein n=1 Tax=Diabrotica virgifera virgifera TaxID=50390 RepID=A0ABM5K6C1_DIAVI|nr:uncharacterized protein LOC126883999 [Diabrotica virgifera virgifera]